jgi:hypothetical protein
LATNNMSNSSMMATEKTTNNHLLRVCPNRNISTFSKKAASAVREAAHVFRIMVCLHSAKVFPSVLRLYGIETVQSNTCLKQPKPQIRLAARTSMTNVSLCLHAIANSSHSWIMDRIGPNSEKRFNNSPSLRTHRTWHGDYSSEKI